MASDIKVSKPPKPSAMVKFSHGCWHPAADTIIDWAVETVKAQARDDSLHFVTVSIFSDI